MSAFSDDMASVATSLITEFGEAITITRSVVGDYDPDILGNSVTSTVTFSAFGFPDTFTLSEIQSSVVQGVTSIQQGDIKLLVHPVASQELLIGDEIEMADEATYRVVNILKTTTNGATVLYTAQIRA